MTMKLTQLTTHWDAGEAYSVITCLDELRDALMAAYGDDISKMLKQASSRSQCDHPPFDGGKLQRF